MIPRVKGMNDIFPEEMPLWHLLERKARLIFEESGFGEIRTPVLEPVELFLRGVGEATDIVQKEMYTLEDRKGRKLALRPEGTAPVVRALLHKGVGSSQTIQKFYYIEPMFRYEKPQKGRLRQHHQLGAEIFGTDSPYADADLITTVVRYLAALGIKDVEVQINSLGDDECRPKYREALVKFLQQHKEKLSEDSKKRLDTNPMRVLDSKEKADQAIVKDAPLMQDFLNDDCRAHFDTLLELLTLNNIAYKKQPRLVRGLDYYTHTVFELVAEGIGAKSAICGGGRYDNLVETLGGKKTPAVGFGMGLERMILLLQKNKRKQPTREFIWIAAMDEAAKKQAFLLASELRRMGVACHFDYTPRTLKSQLSRANKLNVEQFVILGEDELKANEVSVKCLSSGKQERLGQKAFIQSVASSLPTEEDTR